MFYKGTGNLHGAVTTAIHMTGIALPALQTSEKVIKTKLHLCDNL